LIVVLESSNRRPLTATISSPGRPREGVSFNQRVLSWRERVTIRATIRGVVISLGAIAAKLSQKTIITHGGRLSPLRRKMIKRERRAKRGTSRLR
jgi:hypothetical protein